MGFKTILKVNKARKLIRVGQNKEAIRLYEEAISEGLNDPRANLEYATLIIRKGEYQKAKDFLVDHQKTPGMTQDQRIRLLVNYAACCLQLGMPEKGIGVLERQIKKTETGLLYQTLGYLYVVKYDAARKEAFLAEYQPAPRETEPAENAAETAQEPGAQEPNAGDGTAPAQEPALSGEEAWEAGAQMTEEFIRKSIDYDEEDSICLDNMGQYYYRVRCDKAAAKLWFEKALSIKDNQIDTLYFLSRYDEEAGDRKAALEKLEKAAIGRFSPLNYCSRETVEKEIIRLKEAE